MRSIPPAGGIPPNVRNRLHPKAIESHYKVNCYMPNVARMRSTTLERMLEDAKELESKMEGVIKTNPSNDNLTRLDKLQGTIRQLTIQMVMRRTK